MGKKGWVSRRIYILPDVKLYPVYLDFERILAKFPIQLLLIKVKYKIKIGKKSMRERQLNIC